MENLRLVCFEGAFSLRRDSLARPGALEREQVLVQVEAAAVAGPELARATGDARPERGCAVVGVAVDAGSGALHLVGSRVVCGPVLPCGDCDRCRGGLPAMCASRAFVGGDGGEALTSHVIGHARWMCPLAPPIEVAGPEAALLGREAALAYALYVRAGLAPSQRAVVLGRGAVARLTLDILVAQGIGAISVASDDAWAERARAAGAEVVRTEPGQNAAAIRAQLVAMAPEEAAGDALDAILETTGDAALRALAVALARPGAVAVLASRGVTGASAGAFAQASSELDDAIDEGVTVLGVAGPHPDFVPEVAALAARGELDLAAAAAVVPVADLPALAGQLARGELPGRAGVAVWPAST